MKRLDPEQTFIAKIDRISGTGNGIIQLEDTHINIGPVTEGSVGKKIKATMVEEELAYCHTDTVKREGYKEKFPLMAEYDNNSTDNDSGLVGKTAVVRPTRTDSGITDQPAVNIRGKEILIRRAKVGRKIKIKIRIEGENKAVAVILDASPREPIRKEPHKPGEITESESVIKLTSEYQEDSSESTESDNGDDSAPKRSTPEKEQSLTDQTPDFSDPTVNEIDEPQSKEDYINKGSDSVSNSPNAAAEKIEILRKKARRDARERVSTSATTRQTTQQYTRSQAIKEYVKTRANGYCEGCGEPAPFISKTDDPYLHAHHIQELSEGGSDTLDTVVALCPNCHYHVHHGKDGEDYNQQLLEIVQDIEKESVN